MKISSVGDIGDIVYALCILKQIPNGPHTLCLRPSPQTKSKDMAGIQRLHDTIAPMVIQQPYIRTVEIISPGDPVDWKSEDFRQRHYTKGETLMKAHLNHFNKVHGPLHGFRDDLPWLDVEPDRRSAGRVVINRTDRYHNDRFPWEAVVRHYRHRLMFVGLKHEWATFIRQFGYVEFKPTVDLLEVARLIKGSELFIGNQSCAYACAEGLKHPTIQETHLIYPDCVYVRPNAQYVADGKVVLPDGTVLTGPVPVRDRASYKTMQTPPGLWQFPGCMPHPAFTVAVGYVAQHEKISLEEAQDRLYDANVARCPAFFTDSTETQKLARVRAAMGVS